MNDIDWDKIPKEYNWVAMDQDGYSYAYPHKPKKGSTAWISETEDWPMSVKFRGIVYNWETSLQERPSAACQEFPENEVNETYKAFVSYFEEMNKKMVEMNQDLIKKAIEMVSLESVEKSILKSENRDLREKLAELRANIQGLVKNA